jgi:hypothetical protein
MTCGAPPLRESSSPKQRPRGPVSVWPGHAPRVWVRCRNLAGVSPNGRVALGGVRRGGPGAGAHRPGAALGRPHRCRCRLGPLVASSRCGSGAPRSASPPDGRRPPLPAPPAVTAPARGPQPRPGLARASTEPDRASCSPMARRYRVAAEAAISSPRSRTAPSAFLWAGGGD